jgi:hypothetical protein
VSEVVVSSATGTGNGTDGGAEGNTGLGVGQRSNAFTVGLAAEKWAERRSHHHPLVQDRHGSASLHPSWGGRLLQV